MSSKGDAEFARSAVRLMLRKILQRDDIPLPPAFVARFLNEVWVPYLVSRFGPSPGGALGGLSRVTESFFLSLCPAPTHKQRAQLKRFVEKFLPAVREALEMSGWSQDERSLFLDHLAEWHLSILKTGNPPKEQTEADYACTIPLEILSPEYQHYLDCFEADVDYVDLDEIPAPWSPGKLDDEQLA